MENQSPKPYLEENIVAIVIFGSKPCLLPFGF